MDVFVKRSATCMRCGKSFGTTDAADYEGDATCSDCLKKGKEIAAIVDEKIKEKHRNNPPKPPRVWPFKKGEYINWRDPRIGR